MCASTTIDRDRDSAVGGLEPGRTRPARTAGPHPTDTRPRSCGSPPASKSAPIERRPPRRAVGTCLARLQPNAILHHDVLARYTHPSQCSGQNTGLGSLPPVGKKRCTGGPPPAAAEAPQSCPRRHSATPPPATAQPRAHTCMEASEGWRGSSATQSAHTVLSP